MFVLRRLLSLGLVANLLVAGFVGSLHVHTHSGACATCEHVEEPEVQSHCCGHAHAGHCHVDLAAIEGTDPASRHGPVDPHDEDHCSICQLIATAWLPATIVSPVVPPSVVTPRRAVTPVRPATTPLTLPLPRGPPTFV